MALSQVCGATHIYNWDGKGYANKSCLGITGYEGKTSNYGGAVGIGMNFREFSLSEGGIEKFRKILIHEFSHAWNYHVYIKSESDLQSGRLFKEEQIKTHMWAPAHAWFIAQHRRGFAWW